MKKRKIIRIVLCVVLAIVTIVALWLNSEHAEIQLGENDGIFRDHITMKGKSADYTAPFYLLRGNFTECRVVFDINLEYGEVEKIIMTRSKDNKVVSADIESGQKEVEFYLGESITDYDVWEIKVVCNDVTAGVVNYKAYGKEKWITAIKKYRSGAKHHL